MNFLNENRHHLPRFINSLSFLESEAFDRMFSALLSPLQSVQWKMEEDYEDLKRFAKREDRKKLSQSFLGLKSMGWDELSARRILPIYTDYLNFRGTKKGLEILLETIEPNLNFEILERYLPAQFIDLEKFRLGDREKLLEIDSLSRSLTVRCRHAREGLGTKRLEELRSIILSEVPSGLDLYFEFKKSEGKRSDSANLSFFQFGERL